MILELEEYVLKIVKLACALRLPVMLSMIQLRELSLRSKLKLTPYFPLLQSRAHSPFIPRLQGYLSNKFSCYLVVIHISNSTVVSLFTTSKIDDLVDVLFHRKYLNSSVIHSHLWRNHHAIVSYAAPGNTQSFYQLIIFHGSCPSSYTLFLQLTLELQRGKQ